MQRRHFLKLLPASLLPAVAGGCAVLRVDPYHVLIRSPYIDTPEREQEILSRGKVEWTNDGRIRVLTCRGTAYERGYQHGKLLRAEVNDNIGFLYEQAVRKFRSPELLAEIYERMRPYIPQDYVEEMHGLAHGARMPLHVIQAAHILPELGEWSGKKHIKKVLDQMLAGDLATSCSNLCAGGQATADGSFYAVRILDWGMHRISKLHQYPLIAINYPERGIPSANIGWVGFLGCVSGMNAEGITIGEMGYGDPPNETLFGKPMPFMLRDVMTHASNLAEVRGVITDSLPTCSYVFLMTDGKTGQGEMYVRDPDRFLVFHAGDDVRDKKDHLPPIQDTVYGGHYNDRMTEILNVNHGKLTPEMLMNDIIPKIAMPSNFQNVVYDPKNLRFWVANAKNRAEWAASQPYTQFDFGAALRSNKA
ncbi:MAG: C45 family peptidase [Bdellovibrionota bacterium]